MRGTKAALTEQIKAQAFSLGFDFVAVVPAGPAPHARAYADWLASGYAGEMAYMARDPLRRQDPRQVLAGARSIVVTGLNYFTQWVPDEWRNDPSRGLISKYAWGLDYHDVMLPRLRQLVDFTRQEAGVGVEARAYVDAGPILERDWAAAGGIGFFGKNTCLIHPRLGSWLFLGEVLVDLELEYDAGLSQPGCGTCNRCLTACPTRAFPRPYVLDSRRCISYLTIELKGAIPLDLRPLIGNHICGCDDCQDVCPWSIRFARPRLEGARLETAPAGPQVETAPALLSLIGMDDEGFRLRFKGSAVRRAKRRGLLRNVAVALGNWGSEEAVPALAQALDDPEPLIRGHAVWALGRIGGARARRALEKAQRAETHKGVVMEIEVALGSL
jgi:epoxyqueuosine reductase